MTGQRATLTARVALLDPAVDYLIEAVSLVGTDDLARPTPCDDWDLCGLLSHVADVGDALLGMAANGALELSVTDRPVDEVVAVVRDRTANIRARLRNTVAQADASSDDQIEWATHAATSGAVEFAVHGWDVLVAMGRRSDLPADLAATLLTITSQAIPDEARGDQFAEVVTLRASGNPSAQLMSFMGRNVDMALASMQ